MRSVTSEHRNGGGGGGGVGMGGGGGGGCIAHQSNCKVANQIESQPGLRPVYLENFILRGSFKYVWEGPTRSTKIVPERSS